MSLEVRFSAVFVAMLIAGLGSASGLTGEGEYTTHVPEDQLFIDGGRILKSDVVFSIPGKATVVAPEGSELKQTIPPIVWQYSGLLPVTDYVKSAAIHSVSSETQDRPWQDVQHNFYDGLLVEGAHSTEAKIAYAGAYAFAPRWPLTKVVEEASAARTNTATNGDTAALKVEHTQPSVQGMSIESYRELSLQILQQAEQISLLDIQAAIDAIDKKEARSLERASLGGIGSIDSNSNELITGIGDTAVETTARILGSVESVAIVENVASIDQQSSKMNILKGSDSAAEETAPEAAMSGVIGIVVGGNRTLLHSGDLLVLKLADSEIFSERELLSTEDDSANESLDEHEVLSEELMTKKISESANVINTENTQPSAVFSGETSEVVALDETLDATNPAVAANTNADMPEPAVILQPVAISKSAEFARLPVDKLFVSDEALMNTDLQADKNSSDSVDLIGERVDFTELDSDGEFLKPEVPENELTEDLAEKITAEKSKPNDERVVLPDVAISEAAAPAIERVMVDDSAKADADSNTDIQIVASIPMQAALEKPVAKARLPVDKLFISDDAIVNSDQQQDGDSGNSLDVAGAPVDLSGLVIEEDLFDQEAPDTELSEVVAENVTAEEEPGADDKWVVLPDGTVVLQTLNKLYTE